jgi:hypothetical protein
VLLPLLPHQDYEPRILLCGGAEPLVTKPLSEFPAWEPTSGPRQPIRGSASRRRIHLNAVILPTMEIMVCGGFDATGAVQEVELYRPDDDSWTTLPAAATATVARNYHSVALLMPDGRVWTAGGNDRGDWSYHNSAEYENQDPPRPLPTDAQDPGVDNRETQIELFEPPYHGRADRPRIASAPASIGYGGAFPIGTPDAAAINRVSLIRAGSGTHAFNGDQRYVGLRFTRGVERIQATAPPDGNVAPPGTYLLFVVSLIDGEAVPSIGAFVRVGEPLAGEEQAGSLLAAREGAEATARAARLEEGELYRPSPAEEIERGLTRLKPVFETGPQGRPGAHARRDDPRDSDAAPEITTEDADRQT